MGSPSPRSTGAAELGNTGAGTTAPNGTVAVKSTASTEPGSPNKSENSFDDPPLAEELPAVGPPVSVVCLSMMPTDSNQGKGPSLKRDSQFVQRGLNRERFPPTTAPPKNSVRMLRLCSPCANFFEAGIGETYAMLQR